MQRSFRSLWIASIPLLSLSLAACSKDEPAPAEGAGSEHHGAAEPQTPPTETGAGTTEATHGAAAPEAAGAAAPKPEGEAASAAQGAGHGAAKTEDAAGTPEAAPADAPAGGEGAAKAGEEKSPEVAAAEGAEKPAAEKPAEASGKKSGKKKSGDKEAEAPAKEAKPKFAELGIQVTKTGSGTAATEGRTVTLHYKATLADGEKPFDSTFATRRPIEVVLGAGAKLPVIEGLRRGLEGLTPGSEARLQIPAGLAWGEKGNPAVGVPADADVVFEIQVLDVR
ncbi:MAG: FKBP-type peptidyl-prolyl cis-trans isomerase [Planctomycetes bacterium]|nr:FKBP-type peptidyl-prolyl cis-trans isomerase [Planctomycetota bacterium]